MNQGFYMSISISQDDGELDAYIVDTVMENLENWINDRGYSQTSLHHIRQYKRVCIIKSVYVGEECRGEGIGTELLESCIDEAKINSANIIILEADTVEDNNFELVGWYEKHGFYILEKERTYFPLMLKVI